MSRRREHRASGTPGAKKPPRPEPGGSRWSRWGMSRPGLRAGRWCGSETAAHGGWPGPGIFRRIGEAPRPPACPTAASTIRVRAGRPRHRAPRSADRCLRAPDPRQVRVGEDPTPGCAPPIPERGRRDRYPGRQPNLDGSRRGPGDRSGVLGL